MALRLFIILLLGFSITTSFAQSKRKSKKNKTRTEEAPQPTSLDPLPKKDYAPRASKRKSGKGVSYESEQQFYERMEELEKLKRKNERLQDKPQYSDPMYFGHKRPPKKRKPGKMKFCKECGIRH